MTDKKQKHDQASAIVGTTKATMDVILKGDRPAEALALYFFYNYTATWQKTNQPLATVHYCAEGLSWGRDKVRSVKAVLVKHGLVEDVHDTDPKTGRVKGWFIRLPYKLKTSTLLKTSSVGKGVHPPENPDSGKSDPNAFRTGTEMLTGPVGTDRTEAQSSAKPDLCASGGSPESISSKNRWDQDSHPTPTWGQVLQHADRKGIPPETVRAFWILNESNGWTIRGNPIIAWKAALTRFAKVDAERLVPDDLDRDEFDAFLDTFDDPEDAHFAAKVWVRFMHAKNWKIYDEHRDCDMPVRDIKAAFAAWYDYYLDDDIRRIEWNDVAAVEDEE